MTFIKRTALAAALSTLAFAASAQSFSDIYGRDLVSSDGVIQINGNGSMTGTFNGRELNGRWWTEDGVFCREGTLGGTPFGPACQTISMGNGQISFTTTDGARTTTYRIQ